MLAARDCSKKYQRQRGISRNKALGEGPQAESRPQAPLAVARRFVCGKAGRGGEIKEKELNATTAQSTGTLRYRWISDTARRTR